MRFTVSLSRIEPENVLEVAKLADELGFDGIGIPDSICYPQSAEDDYPYTADGKREIRDIPFVDPLTTSAAVGAVTRRVNIKTAVLKLPMRSPVLVAKQVATIMVLTGNRFQLGVGTSPWQYDYEAAGVAWEGRGSRFEEAIAIVKGLMSGEFFGFSGRHFSFQPIHVNPAPGVPVPIIIGGHGDINLRRAATLADGWIAATATPREALPGLIQRLREQLEIAGRGPGFEIHAPLKDEPGALDELEELGVTEATLRMPLLEDDEPAMVQRRRILENWAKTLLQAT